MNKYIKLFSGLMICIFISYGCEKEYITPKVTTPINPEQKITFNADILPIINAKCKGCHGSSNPLNLQTNPYQNIIAGGYLNTSDPPSSKIYKEISDATENHPGGTYPSDAELFLAWIQKGALEK
jgi:hypothetical protein